MTTERRPTAEIWRGAALAIGLAISVFALGFSAGDTYATDREAKAWAAAWEQSLCAVELRYYHGVTDERAKDQPGYPVDCLPPTRRKP